ncbi:thioredoxin family protein [Evansella halocellulosilytica]|uniref:thioredoxin family protein n=1 Tax=Evansella halocellulosilytica TaxID=2011013 RepID=UPI000BB8629A|nr:thioredoxin family protein [Evansella halocellulosilytica]
MKKIIIFGLIVILIFGALAFLTSYQNKQQSEGNPFGKERLYPETIEQLDDPLYSNIILPDELDDKLENEEDVTVYFYSPQCEYCNEASPILIPLADETGVDLELYNILEFEQGWDDHQISATPTLIHYRNGEEVMRMEGLHGEEEYQNFYEHFVLNNG